MLEKLLAAIKTLMASKGIQIGDNEAALKAEIERVIKDNPNQEIDLSKLDLSKFSSSDNGKVLEALVANQTRLEDSLNKIFKLVNDNAEKLKTDQAALDAAKKTQHETDVKKAVDNLILTKKTFPEGMREHLTKIATADLDSFNVLYKDAKAGKEFTPEKPGDEGNKNFAVKSTSGNSKALKAIQEFQASSTSVETETK